MRTSGHGVRTEAKMARADASAVKLVGRKWLQEARRLGECVHEKKMDSAMLTRRLYYGDETAKKSHV